MAEHKSVFIKIKRQDTPTSKPYWEEFELAHHPGMNVISCLMEIAANPVTRDGKACLLYTSRLSDKKYLYCRRRNTDWYISRLTTCLLYTSRCV